MALREVPTTCAKLVAEFIGTFVLVFTAHNNNMAGGQLAGLSVAGSLMTAIYALGSVSGGNFNPAVSMGLAMADCAGHGSFDCGLAWLYVAVQLAAGLAGSFSSALLWNTDVGGASSDIIGDNTTSVLAGAKRHAATPLGSPNGEYDLARVACSEAIYTALLVFVVLNVATCGDELRGGQVAQKNHYFGLAIGLVIVAGAVSIGHISSCSLNPAVSFGVSMSAAAYADDVPFREMVGQFLLYSLAEAGGAVVAFLLFMACRAPRLLDGAEDGEASMGSKLLAEMLGTFFLVLTVCLVVAKSAGSPVLGVVGIAASLIVGIYALAAVSGANFNPAVSFALLLAGKMKCLTFVLYVVSQLVGGLLAVGTAAYLEHNKWRVALVGETGGDSNVQVTAGHGSWGAIFGAEVFYTFLLVFVVLNVAVRDAPNQYYALAIGLVVIAGGVAVGELSGGCFNPAVALAIDFGGLFGSSDARYGMGFVYAGAELLGAALAAVAFCLVGQTEEEEDSDDEHRYERASDEEEMEMAGLQPLSSGF